MYIPWCMATASAGETGTILTADVTRVQNAVNAWSAALSSGPGPLVILHRPSPPGTGHPTTPGLPNQVTGLLVDTLIATQRRRLGR